jgi:hypothetical protein
LLCQHAISVEQKGVITLVRLTLPALGSVCLLTARLKLGLQQRQQQQQQQQQHQALAARPAGAAGMLSAPGVAHVTRFKGTSSMRFKAGGSSSSSSRQLAVTAAGLGGSLDATAPATAAAAARGPVLQGLHLPHQQHQALTTTTGAAAASSSNGWGLKSRQAAAAVGSGDGEPAYFNVDELKHDLERALRKVG